MVAAAVLLDEHPTPLQWLGSGLVLLGFVVHLLGGRLRWFKPQTAP
ncbi:MULTISPECIES: hypothetical protein [Aeromonas]|nr:hypothetical protein [Aeromonas salmonicida]